MKTILFSLFMCFVTLFSTAISPCLVLAEEKTPLQYARVISDDAFLYKTNEGRLDSIENQHFIIPKTYFVVLNDYAGDNYYSATYMGVDGYILRKDVKCISGSPIKPFLNNVGFRVFAQNGLVLRSSPTTQGGLFNKITTIPFLDSNLQFVGKCYSEESVAYRGNEWYFCKYYKGEEEYKGYVYAGYCDMLSNITENFETVTYVDLPNFAATQIDPVAQTTQASAENNPSNLTIILSVALSLVGLGIIVLIFRPARALSSKREEGKTAREGVLKIKRDKHNDYFEIEN